MNRMDSKICIVTGATQGLGAAIARRLASAGAEAIVITGRNVARGQAVAADISKTCPTAFRPGRLCQCGSLPP